MFKIKGILFHVGPLQEFSSYMIKKEFMVSRTGAAAYPNVQFEILGKDITKIDAISLNSIVEVTFDIHGKSYTGKQDGMAKYFNALRVYDISIVPPKPEIDVNTETAKAFEELSVAQTNQVVEEVVTGKAE